MRKRISLHLPHIMSFSLSSRIALILGAEIVIGIFVLVISVLFLSYITNSVFSNEITPLDTFITNFFYSYRSDSLTLFMKFITLFGSEVIIILATIITTLFLRKKRTKESLLFVFMLLFGALLNIILKEVFQRPRPSFDPLFDLDSYSFPSGHAMNSFVFYASLSYFYYHFTRNVFKTLLVVLSSIVMILLIGISRVYLGVHYPSDVIAGFSAGLLWFTLILLLDKTVHYIKVSTNSQSTR